MQTTSSSAEQPASSSDEPTAVRTTAPPVLPVASHSFVTSAGPVKALDQEVLTQTASSRAVQFARRSDALTPVGTAAHPVLPAPTHSYVSIGGPVKALDQEVPLHTARSSAEQLATGIIATTATGTTGQLKALDLEVPLTTTPLSAKITRNFAEMDAGTSDHRALNELEQTFMH